MGVQQLFCPKKGLFQWVGMEDMVSKILKKIKYRSLREKTTPFPHTGWPWWPFNALFVLCRSPVSAATLANTNLAQFSRTGMHIFTITKQVLFAMNRPNVLCSLFAASETLTKGMYIVEVTNGPLAVLRARLANCCTVTGPCPRMDLFVTSHPSAQRLLSMVWLSTTTCTPRRPHRRLRPPLLRCATCA